MRIASLGIAFVSADSAVILGSGSAYAASNVIIDDVQHGTKKPVAIAECRADGSTCSIGAGKTVGSTITGTAGVSFGALNASLSYAYQETYTVTNTCTSRVLQGGEVYVMFPRGDFVFFHSAEGKGTAFLPTGVFCEVRSDW